VPDYTVESGVAHPYHNTVQFPGVCENGIVYGTSITLRPRDVFF